MHLIESPVGAEITLDGRRYVNFGGSSYLGLSGRADITAVAHEVLRANGSGYQFHRHFGVATAAHLEAEEEAAKYFDTETALYLAGGYYFGFIAMASVRDRGCTVFFDELAHHSLREAIAASGLPSYAFRHLDPEDLKAKLRQHASGPVPPLIVTDAMYSTFGQIAPLNELAQVVAPYSGKLIVDESHGFGILGAQGRGAYEHHQLPGSLVSIGGSTGKAFGVVGGIIPTTHAEADRFRAISAGRGAASGLAAGAAMLTQSLRYVRAHPELLERLRGNTAFMKSGLRKLGLDVGDSIAPVATFTAPGQMVELQRRLMGQGIFVFHSNYIGAGDAGVIRCGIFADHTTQHIECLFDALRRLL